MLDIVLFRVDQGGNPDLVRESQRRRYADVSLVDKVIAVDDKWRQSVCCLLPFLSLSSLATRARARYPQLVGALIWPTKRPTPRKRRLANS